jgi:heme exporter protein B
MRYRQFLALLRKDLRLERRTRDTMTSVLLFSVLVMFVFQFGFAQDQLTRFAPGIMWATITLAAVLIVGRAWVSERDQRVLDLLLVSPTPRGLLATAKAAAIFLQLTLMQIVVVPMVGFLFVEGGFASDLGLLAVICLLANLAIALLGTLVAGLAIFTRARELLVPAMGLPLMIPVVIAASGATRAVLGVANDMAEYVRYGGLLAGYAVVLALVAYATYEALFDD